MLQAMIDVGSSAIRMAIYLIEGTRARQIFKLKHRVGLASYVKDGVMSEQGVEKAAQAISEYKELLSGLGIKNAVAFTTAALRNAKNSREAVADIERQCEMPVRVISGDEEAEFDFIGATHDIEEDDGVLVDIGGASTEIVTYASRKITRTLSFHVGSLSLKSRFVASLLPTPDEFLEIRREAEKFAGAEELDGISANVICGLGGSFKSGIALYNAIFDKPANNTVMDASLLDELIGRFILEKNPAESDIAFLLEAAPDRLHTVIPGLVLAGAFAKRFRAKEICYRDFGVREGYLYSEIMPNVR